MNEPITWKEPFEYKLNINKMKEPQEITKAYQKFYGEDAKTQFSQQHQLRIKKTFRKKTQKQDEDSSVSASTQRMKLDMDDDSNVVIEQHKTPSSLESPKKFMSIFKPQKQQQQQDSIIAEEESKENAVLDDDETSRILEEKSNLDLYKVGKVLGKGAYGKVHLGLHKLANMFVAMKSMSKKRLNEGKNNNKAKVDNEVALLKEIDHPGIV